MISRRAFLLGTSALAVAPAIPAPALPIVEMLPTPMVGTTLLMFEDMQRKLASEFFKYQAQPRYLIVGKAQAEIFERVMARHRGTTNGL